MNTPLFRAGARRGLGVGLGLGLVLGLAPGLAGTAGPASAHNYPVGSAPAAGAVVTEQPGRIVVTTNDRLIPEGATAMRVTGPGGLYYGTGCASIDGPSIGMDARLGDAGEYLVEWQAVSADGHPIALDYRFTWEPDAAQTLATGTPAPPECTAAEETGPEDPAQAAAGGAAGDPTGTPSEDARGGSTAGEGPTEAIAISAEEREASSVDLGWILGGTAVVLGGALLALVLALRRRRAGQVAEGAGDAAEDRPGGEPHPDGR